jgi:hypothetical protein
MRTLIRRFILGSLVAASAMAAATSASRAQYYPWCLVISDKLGSWTCYFATREQCMASAGGNVGFCTQNPASPPPQSSPPRRHRAHG